MRGQLEGMAILAASVITAAGWLYARRRAVKQVVLSTPFEDARAEYPVLEASTLVQHLLRQLGCTCYNPNTDNRRKDEGWLLSWLEALENISHHKGIVLLLVPPSQQLTEMQIAESRIAHAYQIPVRSLQMGRVGTTLNLTRARPLVAAALEALVRGHELNPVVSHLEQSTDELPHVATMLCSIKDTHIIDEAWAKTAMGKTELLKGLKLDAQKQVLSLGRLVGLKEMPTSVTGLWALRTIDLHYCPELAALPELSTLTLLDTLCIRECPALRALPDLGKLVSLRKLTLCSCPCLATLPELTLPKLGLLDVRYCNIVALPELLALPLLRKLNLHACERLMELPDLSKLASLRKLYLHTCTSFTTLPDLSTLVLLEHLHLLGCSSLVALPDLSALVAMEELVLNGCLSLTTLPNLPGLKALENLHLRSCPLLAIEIKQEAICQLTSSASVWM